MKAHTFTSADLMKAFRVYAAREQEDGHTVGLIRYGRYGRRKAGKRAGRCWIARPAKLFVSGIRGCPSGVGMTTPTEARHNPGQSVTLGSHLLVL